MITQGQRGLNGNFDRDRVFFDGLSPLEQNALGVTLTIEKELGDNVDLTYVFGRETAEVSSRGDIDGGFGAAFLGPGNSGPGFIPFPSESSGSVDDLTQTTHEIRIAADNDGPLRAQAGIFYFDEAVEITSRSFDTLTPGRPENGRAVRTQDTSSFGLFASASYDVTPQFTLSGGIRFTDDTKDFTVRRITSPFGAGPLGPISGSVADDQISWDVSATYAASDDINYYARIARGFRAPSVQGRLVFGNTVSQAASETVLSYEAGIKSELFDKRARLNTNVFYYELQDQQLTSVGGVNNTVALFNADKGIGYGFEVGLEALISEDFLVTAGLSYNKTEIQDPGLLIPVCGASCTVRDPTQTFINDPANPFDDVTVANVNGNAFPNAPEWIANFTARYAIPVAGGEFYVYSDWAYKGEVSFFLYDSIEFGEDGYWEGGLRAGYQSDAGYEVSLFGRNILDEARLTGGIDFNNLTGFVNEPRTWGIELRWQY